MIFDTHAHFDDGRFEENREELLQASLDAGVGIIVNVASDIPSLDTTPALARSKDYMYCTLGIHPSELDGMGEDVLDRIREMTADTANKVVAVGEIGLDYYWEKDEKEQANQRYWFEKQLRLAEELKLPVVIHSREAAQDTFDMLKGYHNPDAPSPGVIHCYSSSAEMAKEYIKDGWFIGIGGVVTYKNAKTLVRVAEEIPLEHIVIETDCPYLAPTPHRGKTNYSGLLVHVVEKIAEIKGITPEEVERITAENAARLYGISI